MTDTRQAQLDAFQPAIKDGDLDIISRLSRALYPNAHMNMVFVKEILKAKAAREIIPIVAPFWPKDDIKVAQSALYEVASSDRWELIPPLLDLGYRVNTMQPSGQHHIMELCAKAMGRGQWVYPDRLCPDIFVNPKIKPKFPLLAEFLFDTSDTSGIDLIEQISSCLELPEPSFIRKEVADYLLVNVLARAAYTQDEEIVPTDTVRRLCKMGWLDLASVQSSRLSRHLNPVHATPRTQHALFTLLVQVEAETLGSLTPPSQHIHKTPRL